MKTARSVSTITFNTPDFLLTKLQELYTARVLSVWHFILHKGEDDEAGLKDHIHLYVEPAKLIQTDDLIIELMELDPTNEKPIKPLPFRASIFEHWYMYAIHDKAYLESKTPPLKKKYEYSYSDVKTSDPDELYRAVREISIGAMAPIHTIQQAVDNKVTFSKLVATGQVPLSMIQNWRMGYECVLDERKYEENKKRASQKRPPSASGERTPKQLEM